MNTSYQNTNKAGYRYYLAYSLNRHIWIQIDQVLKHCFKCFKTVGNPFYFPGNEIITNNRNLIFFYSLCATFFWDHFFLHCRVLNLLLEEAWIRKGTIFHWSSFRKLPWWILITKFDLQYIFGLLFKSIYSLCLTFMKKSIENKLSNFLTSENKKHRTTSVFEYVLFLICSTFFYSKQRGKMYPSQHLHVQS